jgi:hypothetical protein
VDEVHRQLVKRVREAVEKADATSRRAGELRAFITALRATEPGELVRCAWCGSVRAGELWLDPSSLLGGNLRERLRLNASHGICPACFAQLEAERRRLRP